MKKLIAKYWFTNVLCCVCLFVIYRLMIAEKDYPDENWLDSILSMMDIFLNLNFSLLFLLVIPICALTFFLNLIDAVRRRFYLSLLTFVALPVAILLYVLSACIDLYASGSSIFSTLLALIVFYLVFSSIQFRYFWKSAKAYDDKLMM